MDLEDREPKSKYCSCLSSSVQGEVLFGGGELCSPWRNLLFHKAGRVD